jgi:hypothetical protein
MLAKQAALGLLDRQLRRVGVGDLVEVVNAVFRLLCTGFYGIDLVAFATRKHLRVTFPEHDVLLAKWRSGRNEHACPMPLLAVPYVTSQRDT